MKIYDISQEVFNCQLYPDDPTPEKKILKSMEKGEAYNLTALNMCAHNGTHIDASFHFIITNKGNVKFFEDSTANVGYIKNYYDVTDKNDPTYWEHYFAREIDTMCGQAMENFITKTDLNSILCSGLFFYWVSIKELLL